MEECEEKDESGKGKGWIHFEKFKATISQANVAWEDEMLSRDTMTS